MRTRLLASLMVAASLLLAGCEEAVLYTNLTEREANEMVAVVTQTGMSASKTSKDGKTWVLMTSKREFPQVVALLDARGYPRDRFETLGDVFKKEGFVSTPVEEHARLVYGLSQELSNTISSMNGVVSARVHLSLPEQDPLSETQKPSSAAVLVKYDPQIDISAEVGSIKSLLVNSIEGLPYERVSVVLSPAPSFSPVPAQGVGLRGVWTRSALGLGVLAAALGVGAWFRRAPKPARESR